MLQRHYARGGYAEIIMDSAAWRRNLPQSVEAMFYPKSCLQGSPCRAATQRAHAALLKEHGLTHEELPLLTLDQEDLETPFEEAPESFDDGAVADAPAER